LFFPYNLTPPFICIKIRSGWTDLNAYTLHSIEKNKNELVNRDFLIRFFNPKQDGTMYITRNNISRKIQYRVSSLDFPTNKMYENIDFSLVL